MTRFLATFALASTLWAGPGQPRGITPEDYYSFSTVTDPHISPDGKWVAYTVTRVDKAANRRMSRIWMAAADGATAPQPLTAEGASCNSPRWSPNGKYLGFLSTRDGLKAQIWLLPMTGGEATRLTNFDSGISNIEWSPDSTRLLGLVRVGPPPTTKSDVRHYTRIKYKLNDSGYFDDLRAHIAVVDVKSGVARQVTNGDGWNDKDAHWAPDSKRIVFISDRSGKEFDLTENENVWVLPEGGMPERVTAQAGAYSSPVWSPDGQRIAYLGDTDAEDIPLLYIATTPGCCRRLPEP